MLVRISSEILKYGSYYVGYEAQYCETQCMAKKEHLDNNLSIVLLKQEWKVLDYLQNKGSHEKFHPCVVQVLNVLNDVNSLVLLMERMWMSLSEFLSNKHSHHDKISILHDAACGLNYIHEKGIVHYNLTGDSILLTEKMTAKLADFGRANFCQQTLKLLPETPDHLPPEIIYKPYSKASYSTKVDIFAFGSVIIHTFIQECPTPDFEEYAETFEVGKYKKLSEIERRSICLKKFKIYCKSIKLRDIVLKCLQDNPDYRPTAKALLSLLKKELIPNSLTFSKLVSIIL